jgi:hypothetical protein
MGMSITRSSLLPHCVAANHGLGQALCFPVPRAALPLSDVTEHCDTPTYGVRRLGAIVCRRCRPLAGGAVAPQEQRCGPQMDEHREVVVTAVRKQVGIYEVRFIEVQPSRIADREAVFCIIWQAPAP